MLTASLLPIESGATRLRTLRDADAQAYAEGVTAIAVSRFGRAPRPAYTPASVREMIAESVAPGLERGDLAVLAIADAASDAFVGSLVVFDATDESAELGFWLHPDHRGRGHVARVLSAAHRFAAQSGLRTLTARVAPDNLVSQRRLEQAGFVRTAPESAPATEDDEFAQLSFTLDIAPEAAPPDAGAR